MKSILILFITTLSIFSQAQSLPEMPRNIKQAYENGTRNKTGAPGDNYWQNEANYKIDIQFDPKTRRIEGSVKVIYKNNSPDSLNQLLVKLNPNIFKKGSLRKAPINPEDIGDGINLSNVQVNGIELENNKIEFQGTNAYFSIPTLEPNKSIELRMNYSYILERDSPYKRTGQIDETTFFVAYFFPRIAVYDDIDGWNTQQFLGLTEFYNDFSNFEVKIKVPKNFAVWATGELVNCSEVFTDQICQRIAKAESSSAEVNIIEESSLKINRITQNKDFNTFHFIAENVTDFAFSTSDHYLWKSTSTIVDRTSNKRTRVDVVYDLENENFSDLLDITKKTVEAISYYYPKWPFPYPKITVFKGFGGMEYPMMVNQENLEDSSDKAMLNIHEVFHTIFPFYVGINEKKYAWMDEGFATAAEYSIYPHLYPGELANWGIELYSRYGGLEIDTPIMTLSYNLFEEVYYLVSYFKTAAGLYYIKELLSDEKFFRGFHYYIENWNGKHPTPWDFFYSINTGSGENLNWFWNAWFFENSYPDLAIGKVSKKKIEIQNKGKKPVPIKLHVDYADGSSEIIQKSIEVWKKGNEEYTIELSSTKEIKSLELKDSHIPDVDPSNNSWNN